MQIKKSRLTQIIKEEISRIAELEAQSGPTAEQVLEALEVLSQANPTLVRENVEIFEKIANRIKNT